MSSSLVIFTRGLFLANNGTSSSGSTTVKSKPVRLLAYPLYNFPSSFILVQLYSLGSVGGFFLSPVYIPIYLELELSPISLPSALLEYFLCI